MLSPQQIEAYHRDGYSFPHQALSDAELAECREGLARFEAWLGKPVNHGDWRWRSQAYAFLPWLDRLIRASGTRAPVVVASAGVTPIPAADEHAQGGFGHDHGDHARDPHAWQNIANVKIYVANIRDGLAKVDPAHADTYRDAAAAYIAKLDALEREVRATIDGIPPDRRRIITTHDAFGYFAAAYGLRFVAPQGVSTDSEASPRDVAAIIRQIRRDRIPAVFLENISDPRQMEQIARESGATIGGKVFSDALSGPAGPAPTYLAMMRSNLHAFAAALGPG